MKSIFSKPVPCPSKKWGMPPLDKAGFCFIFAIPFGVMGGLPDIVIAGTGLAAMLCFLLQGMEKRKADVERGAK